MQTPEPSRSKSMRLCGRRLATLISFDRRFPRRITVRIMGSMCDTCHAGCCRAYHLLITVYDALRISQDLALPIGEFVAMVPQTADGSKRLGDQHHPIRFSDPGYEDTYFYLGLKRVDSRLAPGTLKCYFLQEWSRAEDAAGRGDHPGAKIIGRCGIYASRPLMCRAYPTSLHADGNLAFIGDPKVVDLQKTNAIYTLCPEPWSPAAFGPDCTTVVQNLALNRYEVSFQNKLVDEWNTNPRALREFFPHAVRCYGARLRAIPPANPAPARLSAPTSAAIPPN